jgi:hypothetical protein
LRSITVESYEPTVTVVAIFVPPRPIVNVPAEPAVFVTTMLVTTVVVAAGTVYRVVPTVVVAAPRNSALVVVAIISLS